MERGDAFVIWLDPPDGGSRERLHGLAEHVPSSTRLRFATADELLAFVHASRRPAPDLVESEGSS